MRTIKRSYVFDLNYMIPGHVYLLSIRDERREMYGILVGAKKEEAVFLTIMGSRVVTPEKVNSGEVDIKELRIEVDGEAEELENTM